MWYNTTMDFVDVKSNGKMRRLNVNELGLHTDMILMTIKSPKSWILKFVARALILAIVIVSIPRFGSIFEGLNSLNFPLRAANYDTQLYTEYLPELYRDLATEGLLKTGDRVLYLNNGDQQELIYGHQMFNVFSIDFVSNSDIQRQVLMPNETFECVLVRDFHSTGEFVNRVLKSGGVAVIELSDDPSLSFRKPSNYEIVYLRRFDRTFMAMRKAEFNKKASSRRLLSTKSEAVAEAEAKRAALKKLEDVLLEPPRSASGKSRSYIKRTRYLPDLMRFPLRQYPRRVFINVGFPEKNDAATEWFSKHYPTRNEEFDIFKIEIGTGESAGGMSDWLTKNVREEEYVVMKAEADVVEEMVRSKSIKLVDELFMECNHQGIKAQNGRRRSKRAYWECLALYGVLRDEGVAVHQWWG